MSARLVRNAVLALSAALWLMACGGDDEGGGSTTEPEPVDPVEVPGSTPPATGQPAPTTSATPSPPATTGGGGAGGSCSGSSIDPPSTEMNPALEARRAQRFPEAYTAFNALATRYPQSSTVRVYAADAALNTRPPNSAEAARLTAEAQRLHQAGCHLPTPYLEWVLNGARSIVALVQHHPDQAIPILQEGIRRWPESPTHHYNLSCAYCLTQNVDGCHQELVNTFTAARAGRLAQTIGVRAPPVQHYINLSRGDPDLAPLRADPRYEQTIARFSAGGQAPAPGTPTAPGATAPPAATPTSPTAPPPPPPPPTPTSTGVPASPGF